MVSLDMLKLYHGEDVIHQDPEDIDPNQWLDEGKLTELSEAPLGEMEMRSQEPFLDPRSPEISPEPGLGIPVIPEDPQVREGYKKEYRQRSIMKTRRRRLRQKKC